MKKEKSLIHFKIQTFYVRNGDNRNLLYEFSLELKE